MKYGKLVRDNIPEKIRANGESCIFHIASEVEYGEKLKEKLQEEVKELLEAESLEEMADVLEVLEAMRELNGYSEEELYKIKSNKKEKNGGFSKRVILDES
jgi:predicted house-cleaning noncanonical NTP pyrophosphatase (MazG superfamily)